MASLSIGLGAKGSINTQATGYRAKSLGHDRVEGGMGQMGGCTQHGILR
ncbi:MAG: hypothetical protein JJK57_13210 [Komagataeibacter hansenii]|nr:hypothetical protein [Novacetimonas hansenii]MBL7237511.1 hypothetical protein [Novacetimonas hansenii]